MISSELGILLDNNQWQEAINLIESTTSPLNDDELSSLAWCYSRLGKYDLAIKLYDEMIERQPQKAKWYYAKGYQFYMQKNWQNAIEFFSIALSLHDTYFVVKYRISYAYIQLSGNKMQWSKDSFWKAIRHLEDCHKIFATYSLEEQQKAASTYADICALHGKTIMTSERYLDKSIELLKKAIEFKDDNDFKYQLSKAYYSKKQYAEALSALPSVDKPYYIAELKGQILSKCEKYDESNRILLSLIKFRKKDYLYRRIAENYLRLGNVDKAEAFADRAITINKKNYKNFYVSGLIQKHKQLYKTAIISFEKARLLKQNDYNLDCVEAIGQIDEINSLTNNNPTDAVCLESPNKSTQTGKIVKYNSDKGFGFILDSETSQNVFFHISNVMYNGVKTGQKVSYNIEKTKKGLNAIEIREI